MDSRSRQRIANYKNNARNADDMRKERVKKFAEDRKMKRAEAGLLRRNLEVSPVEAPKPISIKSKLEKWKSDKLEKERLAKRKARPPFWTGKVRHKVGSPYSNKVKPLTTSQRMKRSATKKNKDESKGVGKNTIQYFKFKAPANIVPIPLSYSSTKARIITGKDKGETPVPKAKVPSTPFIQHNLIDLDNTCESSLNILQDRLETPKRPRSLRRSRILQKIMKKRLSNRTRLYFN